MSELCCGGDGGQVGEQGRGSPSWEDLEVREEAVPELEEEMWASPMLGRQRRLHVVARVGGGVVRGGRHRVAGAASQQEPGGAWDCQGGGGTWGWQGRCRLVLTGAVAGRALAAGAPG